MHVVVFKEEVPKQSNLRRPLAKDARHTIIRQPQCIMTLFELATEEYTVH